MKKVISVMLGILLISQSYLPALADTKQFKDDYLSITRKTRPFHSRLSKKYTGYEYTIKSISGEPISIEDVSIKDNVSGGTAYISVKRTGVAEAAEAIAWGAGLVLALTLFLVGAIIASPFIIVSSLWDNVGADMEGKRFDKSVTDNVKVTDETLLLKSVAPHDVTPSVTVLYNNPKTRTTTKLICD